MMITKSFLLDFIAYKRGQECGNILHYKWVEGKLTPGTNAMRLGNYFEFNISGALPKEGKVPLPEYQKSNPGKLYADWQRALERAAKVKELLNDKGLKIIGAGVRKKKDDFGGTLDLICEVTKEIIFDDGFILRAGQQIVIDLKYSGLLYDRWNEYGWLLIENGLPLKHQIDHHKWQARQYHYVSGLPFFYLVCSSGTDEGIEMFRFDISKEGIEEHIRESKALMEEFEILRDTDGFEPRPSYSKCIKCPIKKDCKSRHDFPQPKRIEI